MDYSGKIITKNAVEPSQTSAPGVWTLDQAAQAVESNTWPIANVPNPISRSLRFNSADTTYLNRTPTVAGSLTTWTYSTWVKRSTIDAGQRLLFAWQGTSGTIQTHVMFQSNNTILFEVYNDPTDYKLITTQVFRDPSAWYHLVAVYDSTNATSGDRMRLYVNGSRITAFGTAAYPSQNYQGVVNNTNAHNIGRRGDTGAEYFTGYMAQTQLIDGQALDASYFGMTDPRTGAWISKPYTGTYGTNGFYLNFSDNSSTAALGTDYSGNSNTWTTNNFSVTAGSGNDSLIDVPTPWIPYNTTGDVGGVFRGNYATLNPLDEPSSYAAYGSASNGNLDFSVSNDAAMGATFAVSSGKWYWETTVVSGHTPGSNTVWTAIASSTPSSVNKLPNQSGSGGRSYATTGSKFNENTSSSYGNTYTNGDVIGCALDLDNGKVYWSKNGTFQASGDPVAGTNAAFTGLTGTWLPVAFSNAPAISLNFGQRPFAYTPPAGFKSLCTTNLPEPTVLDGGDYFNAVLWNGATGGTNLNVTGFGFQPDFIWSKNRNDTYSHYLQDAVRGITNGLSSNSTAAETTTSGSPTSFISDGFNISSTSGWSSAGNTEVTWAWKANGAGSSNSDGTITSTVSANTTAGFSIVKWASSSYSDTIGHGLGVQPSMIIAKETSISRDWLVYHKSLGNSYYLNLNTTNAATTPNNGRLEVSGSNTFICGTDGTNQIAYCFAAVPGYSAFGSYTGNGSADGPFVFTGFRPRYVLLKRTNTTGSWYVWDTVRDTYNWAYKWLAPNDSAAENTSSGANVWDIDILSSGFKIRNDGAFDNGSGSTYIYAAFAENPFKYSNAR